VRCGIGHAARSARGAKPSRLAGIRDQPLAPAVLAADAEKAAAEKTAIEEGAKLTLDEAGDDATLFPSGREKELEVLLHDSVENAGLRRAPLVLRRVGQAVADRGLTRHGP
jgi:hypothetical protein